MEDLEKEKCTQHMQLMLKGIEDLKDIEDGSQTSHGNIKDQERMLDEWRLNVAICSDLGND